MYLFLSPLLLCVYISNVVYSDPNIEKQLFPFEDLPPIWPRNKKYVKYTLENFPNPLRNYKACNRHNPDSYLCDPGNIDKSKFNIVGVLEDSEADRIEEILRRGRRDSSHSCTGLGDVPFNFGVCIANDNLRDDKHILATELCKRWSLSHTECNDGVILVLFPFSNDMILYWEPGVEPTINAKIASAFYRMCREELTNKRFGQAAEKCIKFVSQRLSGATLPMEETMRKIVFLIIATVSGLFYITCMISVLVDRIH